MTFCGTENVEEKKTKNINSCSSMW